MTRRIGFFFIDIVLRLDCSVVLSPLPIHDSQIGHLIDNDRRPVNGFNENLVGTGLCHADNSRCAVFKLATRAQGALNRKDHIIGRQSLSFVEANVFANLKEKSFGYTLPGRG